MVMSNHPPPPIAVPTDKGRSSSVIGEIHRRYARMVNSREGWRDYFWQGRFFSFIMDKQYLLVVTRYIALNPVKAKLVNDPIDCKWSSYKAHLEGENDKLVKVKPLLKRIDNWTNFIQEPGSDIKFEKLLKQERTGCPFGNDRSIEKFELETGRSLRKKHDQKNYIEPMNLGTPEI